MEEALSRHTSSWSINLLFGPCFRKTRKEEWLFPSGVKENGDQHSGLGSWPTKQSHAMFEGGRELGQGTVGRDLTLEVRPAPAIAGV